MEHGRPYCRIPRKSDRRQRRPVPKPQLLQRQLSVPRASLTLDPALICGATSALRVAARSVHVWAFELEASVACLDQCRQTLCSAEQARAARFVHARSRDDFVVAHGVLRRLLGRYTGTAARDLRFSSAPNGKPALDPSSSDAGISFNMTHSHGRALIAISDGREIGIDLEKVKSHVKALAIAQRYFARAERVAIESAPPPLQAQVFFRYWVAKEALLKGQGIGLRFPIDEFEVQFDAENSIARVCAGESSRLSADWKVHMLPFEADWAGAVAVRGADWTLRFESDASASEHGGAG
jgi:4'-phosphopantetheinyl transferase